jgi:hypothetical protein
MDSAANLGGFRMNRWLLHTSFLSASFTVAAQPDGYWQQEVNYVIHVRLDDSLHELTGDIAITYVNNSPQTLDSLYFHLWPNAYSDLNTAYARQQRRLGKLDFHFSAPQDRGYIDGLAFKVDGRSARLRQTAEPDVAVLYLNEPLNSGSRITVTTPFHVKIPKTFSRLGHHGQQYQITQWYPKPAVFDRGGWHPMPYLDIGEFYADVGSFEVHITVPDNYVVAATGNLQDQEELEWLRTRSSASWLQQAPPSSKTTKTLTFIEHNVHDFAWFADKTYWVARDSVRLPSGHEVTTWGFFNGDNALSKSGAHFAAQAVEHYSTSVGEYPYDNCSVVQGALVAGSGMEYPTITVIGEVRGALEQVIAHEVGHNWFQGMLATNEREYAWMDEGINSFYELTYMRRFHDAMPRVPQGNAGDLQYLNSDLITKLLVQHLDLQRAGPPSFSDPDWFTELEYGALVYGRVATAIDYLRLYLDDFDGILQSFFATWKYKHPTPLDMREFFETRSGKDLGWFFDGLMGTRDQVDYAVTAVRRAQGSHEVDVTITNKGEITAPVAVAIMIQDSVAAVEWFEGFAGDSTVRITVAEAASHLQLDPFGNALDVDPHNNVIRLRGVVRRLEPPQFPLIIGLPNPRTTQLFFAPVAAWNHYDGLTAGILFYNSLFPSKNTEFTAMPMFGFKSVAPVGMASLTRYVYPKRSGFNWSLGISAKSFHYDDFDVSGYHFVHRFIKLQPQLRIAIKPSEPGTRKYREVTVRSVLVRSETYDSHYNPIDSTTSFTEVSRDRYVNELAFRFGDRGKHNPFASAVTLQHNNHMVKLMLEVQQGFTTKELPRDIRLRLFGGAFIVDNLSFPEGLLYPINLSGPSGSNDYMFDHTFAGRSEFEGLLYQQIVQAEGAFKVRTDRYPFGRSDGWLLALNLSVPLPVPVPIDVFADVATFSGAATQTLGSEPIVWEIGASIPVWPGIFEVYVPIVVSQDLKTVINDQVTDDQGKKHQLRRVSFTLHLEKLDMFRLARELRGPR